ncbi:MAG: ATP-binding protein [Planctomycetota bacterium]
MNKLLVIQPDSADRSRVVETLERLGVWEADAVATPGQALDRLVDPAAPGRLAVICDLAAAVADDSALLAAIRKTCPPPPVLLTGRDGTPDQVVAALDAGASDFVHLDRLDADLVERLERALNAAHRSRTHARLLDCMTSSVSTFVLENDPLLLPTVLTRLQNSVAMFDICDEAGRTRLGIALEEALSNALYHGNLEVSSDLRNDSLEAYFELAGERRETPPYRDRRIHITETLTADEARFTIRDEGPGFDTSRVDRCDPCDDNLEALSGRGLLLMKSFVDELTYNAKGNEVTLVKRKQNEAGLTLAA